MPRKVFGHPLEKLEDQMADPDFYNGGHNVAAIQKTYNQVLKDLAEQEELWLAEAG